ncbi:response regulator transcription factor [Paractinoplanes ferrugineus]|uniref:DNA-binding response regulator n=1 Tax=Paractinoplanes ferrugineus TaxID=113564 RepID=A0A919J7Y1_9ACTN|nr:DNA-binding response regulator [Actinoplanes ferrugineus]
MAEDDRRQADLLGQYLRAAGHEVSVVHDGRSALTRARRQPLDLLVLDVLMPRIDGWEVCRVLRRDSDVMVLMLTARSSEEDLLTGLGLGADDYLTKPYSPRELVARVETLLRRRRPAILSDDEVYVLGPLTVDAGRHRVEVAGTVVDCTPGEFAILAAMAARPERVFSRAQLLDHTRGVERSSTARTIDMHVVNLRRKIEANPRRPALLVTVYGLGYKLTGDPR